jgi:hypothetical protein
LEEVMRHFYLKAMVEKSLGARTDWKAVDVAMVQAGHAAERVAAFRHPKLSSVRLSGELSTKSMDGATLEDLIGRIKAQLIKLGPIIEVEVARDPEGIENRMPITMSGSENATPPPRRPAGPEDSAG